MGRLAACTCFFIFVVVLIGGLPTTGSQTDDSDKLLTVDHYVPVRSMTPAIAGQAAQIYVRERVKVRTVLRGQIASDRIVLFVHGAGTPGEVAFDVPYKDYSWMGYLAGAGFDVFSMDITGYGRSTRPAVMNDPCNLSAEQQAAFIPSLLSARCAPAYPHQLTTLVSDWNDVDAVVNYLRALRQVDRVSLIGWSLGGPRTAGYAAQHPDKIKKLILLAPAYNRMASATPPAKVPPDGVPMNTQSQAEFIANWDRQVGCSDQIDPAVRAVVWSTVLESDPLAATWGPGVRRAPSTASWGWNAAAAAKIQLPTLMVVGEHDKQVAPDRVRELYSDLGSREKVFAEIACSSHFPLWERNHMLLFRASLEWLTQGSVNGTKEGMVRLGY